MGSSAVSLHLPSTSGHKKPLSAHRSHEDIGRRKSHNDNTEETRYHSAPSVIDEVLHRRDWERSNKELHIPLNPQRDSNLSADLDKEDDEVKAPYAVPETSSIDSKEEAKPCKKHHTNIKSSKSKKDKESTRDDIKDDDATETTEFYIGDREEASSIKDNNAFKSADIINEMQSRAYYKAKEAKQCFNESVRSKEKPKQTLVPLDEHQPRMFGFCLDDVIDQLESLDRSGAMHHSIESRVSIGRPFYPPPSCYSQLHSNYDYI
ncbi:hypothetical protein K1T71_012487 [Dendrolimus kikuchii]|uniref:Uncharacterized protein n=1 Tax=Dendrolimus kikuchii TaxID=765133 RepID=A0ACC1CJG7_9NEOP|nr:hypothetical protein K1T71_012487 [Dendrolimus kikuchii]